LCKVCITPATKASVAASLPAPPPGDAIGDAPGPAGPPIGLPGNAGRGGIGPPGVVGGALGVGEPKGGGTQYSACCRRNFYGAIADCSIYTSKDKKRAPPL
jgi:hypothetical protein